MYIPSSEGKKIAAAVDLARTTVGHTYDIYPVVRGGVLREISGSPLSSSKRSLY